VQDDEDIFAALVEELAVEDRFVLPCGLGEEHLHEAFDHGSPPFLGFDCLESGMAKKALEFIENSGPYWH
jgi:hypothetical protein